ncbi:MAG: PAS domain-containing protein [Sediminicola sp.]
MGELGAELKGGGLHAWAGFEFLDALPCSVVRYVLYNNGKEEIRAINKGARELFNLGDEMPVPNIWDQVFTEDRERLRNSFSQSAKDLTEWKSQWRIHSPDGGICWHRGRGYPKQLAGDGTMWDCVITDITEETSISDALEGVNQKLLQAQKIGKLGYWKIEHESGNIYWSDEMYSIWGVSKNDFPLTRESIIHTIHPDHREEYIGQRNNYFRGSDFEFRILLPDGSIKWIHGKGRPLKEGAGTSAFYEGTVQDITEKKLTTLHLEETIQRYNYVVKATSDAIWDLDFLNEKLFWGENYKTLFGHSSSEEAKANLDYWESMIRAEDRSRVMKSFYGSIEGSEEHWEEEYQFEKGDGQFAWVRDRAFIIRNAAGKAIRMVGSMQDITDVVLAVEEIRKSNERFAKVAEATNDAIWDWDLQRDYLYHGPGYYKLFGHKPEDGQHTIESWKQFVHPDDLGKAMEEVDEINSSKDKTYFVSEYRYKKSDGSYANIIDRGSVIRDTDGAPLRIIGAMQDVTERKVYIQALLDQNKKLQEIAWIQSHLVRAPVARIMGLVEMLKAKGPESDGEREFVLDEILNSAQEFDQVIREISQKAAEIKIKS